MSLTIRELSSVAAMLAALVGGNSRALEAPVRDVTASDQWVLVTGHPDAVWLATMADSNRVPRFLMWAVTYEESRYNLDPTILSVKGALGRMQILPSTAALYCPDLDITQYEDNVRCGARILRAHRDELGSWDKAVTRYVCRCQKGLNAAAIAYREQVFASGGRFAIRLQELAL